MKIQRVCGHTFVKDLMVKPAMVFDCGANHGEFSKWISANADAIIHGFEPDPRLFPALPALPNVYFHNFAVSGTGDPLTLYLGETRCSSAYIPEKSEQESISVKSVKLDTFCSEQSIDYIDLLKIDVEGAEIDILENLQIEYLGKIAQITVEFHDFLKKSDIPRIRNVIAKLRRCNFHCIRFSHYDYSDVLCINKSIHKLKWHEIIRLQISKYFKGLKRMVRRKLAPYGPA